MREKARFVGLYGEIILSFSEGIIDHTAAQTMLYLPCPTISGVDLAHNDVSHANYGISVDYGTNKSFSSSIAFQHSYAWYEVNCCVF